MQRDKAAKIFLIASIVVFVLAIVWMAYEPLKFRYAIWRIETAKTPAEEKDAFSLARRVGYVWEVNRIDRKYFDTLPKRVKRLTNEWVLEIEWIEYSRWTKEPYRAYRILLERTNRNVLVRK